MILLGARAALQPPPASCSPGGQPEQAPLALRTRFLPSFGARTLTDSKEVFHCAPQLTDNSGDRRLAGIHAAQQKGPWYLLVLVLTGPDSILQEVFNVTNKPVGMACFTQPCG